jgi:hypothetical protein
MIPHPDFADRPLPRQARFGPFRLDILTPDDVQEDFDVVTESTDVLWGLFGDDWPKGLTLEENLKDLQRHEREFDVAYAFAWIIRSEDGRYLGCAYVKPTPDISGESAVFTWIRTGDDRLSTLAQFNTNFRDWLTDHLPEGYALRWTSNDGNGEVGEEPAC